MRTELYLSIINMQTQKAIGLGDFFLWPSQEGENGEDYFTSCHVDGLFSEV